jgi:IclR family KDG regulon transcriptional repressor
MSSPKTHGSSSSPERLLDILLMLETEEAISLQQIAARFGGSRSSNYRDIGFLKARGFIEEAGSGTFRLGTAVDRLANSAGAINSLSSVARPHLETLAHVTRESVLLCRRSGTRVHILVGIDSRQMLRVSVQAANNQPLHCGSFGKVLLAFQGPDIVERMLAQPLEKVAERTVVDASVLRHQLTAIRKRGYAISDSEVEAGTRSISIPVWGGEEDLLGSITVAAPSVRMPAPRTSELLKAMADAARAIAVDWADRSGCAQERDAVSPNRARAS